MLFNSYEFILLYLPITLILYYWLAKWINNGTAKNFLIFSSLCFYSYWDVRNLPILLSSILANYLFGHFLSKSRSKVLLVVGITFNLLFLVYFKYTDFILQNLNSLAGTVFELQSIVLPLGISFFTFTQTAYLVDIYRGETKEYSKSDYLLFVTIFPHLIAGPILYHKDMIPQFSIAENYKINYKNLTYGFVWFTIGLFKKVVIADKLAIWANQVFNNTSNLTMFDAWGGSLAYSLQLYFDFSGYSEMAVGLGLLFNYNLPLNFNSPYMATSIIDFWRRWHISLSTFLKNYLYIPLGGNRNGKHLCNILITMLLGGFWHGAGWTFIFWGLLHGIFICINHLWHKTKIVLPKFFCWLLTFNAVNIAWIFFRADSCESAMNIVKAMFFIDKLGVHQSYILGNYIGIFRKGIKLVLDMTNTGIIVLLLIVSFLIITVISFNKQQIEKINEYLLAIVFSIIFLYAVLSMGKVTEFLYFQF